jgi:hypothetical protein
MMRRGHRLVRHPNNAPGGIDVKPPPPFAAYHAFDREPVSTLLRTFAPAYRAQRRALRSVYPRRVRGLRGEYRDDQTARRPCLRLDRLRSNHLKQNLRRALHQQIQLPRGNGRQVDDPARLVRPAVVDTHYDALSIFQILDAHPRSKWIMRMCRGQLRWIVAFPVRRNSTTESVRVVGGDSHNTRRLFVRLCRRCARRRGR